MCVCVCSALSREQSNYFRITAQQRLQRSRPCSILSICKSSFHFLVCSLVSSQHTLCPCTDTNLYTDVFTQKYTHTETHIGVHTHKLIHTPLYRAIHTYKSLMHTHAHKCTRTHAHAHAHYQQMPASVYFACYGSIRPLSL